MSYSGSAPFASATPSATSERPISGVVYGGNRALCNSTTAHANATGIVHFEPTFEPQQGALGPPAVTIPEASWLVTVTGNASGEAESVIWINPNGSHYWDNVETHFDACAYLIRPGIPMNTIQLGQNDPGDCSIMLSTRCRQALLTSGESMGQLLVWQYASDSKPSLEFLPHLCADIANSLITSSDHNKSDIGPFPLACAQDFGYDNAASELSTEIVRLTGPNKSSFTQNWALGDGDVDKATNVDWSCPITDDENNTYYSTYGFNTGSYDLQTRMVTPVLSLYFTMPNAEVGDSFPYQWNVSSQLSCPRVTNFTAGSRTSPVLPAGTPYSSTLSVHAKTPDPVIAFIVLFSTFILVALVFWIRKRWRSRKKTSELNQPKSIGSEEHATYEIGEAEKRHELSCVPRTQEADGVQILEAGNSNASAAVELNAEPSINSSRPSLDSLHTTSS